MLSPSSNLREPGSRRLALAISACLLLAMLAPIFIRRFDPPLFNRILASSSNGTTDAVAPGGPATEVKRGSVRKTLLLDGELRAVRSRTIYGSSSEEAKIVYLPPEGSVVKA